MHVLLLAADAAVAESLADAWRSGAAGSVEPAVLPPLPSAPVPTGVFVPVSALGLTTPPPVHPVQERLRTLVTGADVVVVHVDVLDGAALHEGALPMVAHVAADRAVPVVVLAGRVEVSRREWSAGGVSGVHEVGDTADARTRVVARVGQTWAPSWSGGPGA